MFSYMVCKVNPSLISTDTTFTVHRAPNNLDGWVKILPHTRFRVTALDYSATFKKEQRVRVKQKQNTMPPRKRGGKAAARVIKLLSDMNIST